LTSVGNHLLIRTECAMFHKVPHAFMEHFLMGIPEMQRFPLRLQAISASKFEGSPNRFEGHRLTPYSHKKTASPSAVPGKTCGRSRPSSGGKLDALHLLVSPT